MGIFKRLQDIISANLNELVDGMENPEAMLRQAVDEMEIAIGESKREVAKAMANEKLVQRDLEANRQLVRDWQARAEKAVQARDDALARMALGKKQEYAGIVSALEEQSTSAAETTVLLRQQLEAMQNKLGEAKLRLGTLSARLKAAEVRTKVHAAGSDIQLDQSAFQKFDRMKAKVERAEAEAEAMRDLDRSLASGGSPAPMSAPASRPESGLDAELDALKRKLNV
jgi:phage shock protein A